MAQVTTKQGNGGVAPIKPQFIVQKHVDVRRPIIDDDVAERTTNPASGAARQGEVGRHDENGEPMAKAPKLKGAARRKAKIAAAAEERKRDRGMNTSRKFERIRDENLVCYSVARGQPCVRGESCKFSHSIKDYLATKPKDIRYPRPPTTSKLASVLELSPEERLAYIDEHYSIERPFARFNNDGTFGSIDLETSCPVVAAQEAASSSSGQVSACYAGWTCRFLGGHVRKAVDGQGAEDVGWELTGGPSTEDAGDPSDGRKNAPDEVNWLDLSIPKKLKSRKYPLYLTEAALQHLENEKTTNVGGRGPIAIDVSAVKRRYLASRENGANSQQHSSAIVNGDHDMDDLDALMNEDGLRQRRLEDAASSTSLTDIARIRPSEKRRLDWFHDELYLAPLTTTGNLPFRRLCVSLGADITCGEMGLADSYLQGSKNEWSLVRRWEGERCFGTQVCGNKPEQLVPTAEVLAREFPRGLDFIDVNCGCPIDMVYNRGAGSALLDHGARLGRIVRAMSAVTGDIPITVKLRTGTTNTQTTHKLFPKLKVDWNVGAATLHGRSRQQRYKHTADWHYIKQCTESLRESIRVNNEERPDEEWVHPVPIYGNGDVYSWQDYEANKALTGVDGQMLARGALVKPWLFTEIKERRDWDISSRERLDQVRQLCSYGVTHWGSDSLGVNLTRRFVCEALSFTHRYIPIGILEHLPVHMHDRPPPFYCRDDLETLLASSSAQDWVRITEMFLGKAPEEWSFTRE